MSNQNQIRKKGTIIMLVTKYPEKKLLYDFQNLNHIKLKKLKFTTISIRL